MALALAARVTLHMADIVEDMLRKSMVALMTNDRKVAADVSRMDKLAIAASITSYVLQIVSDGNLAFEKSLVPYPGAMSNCMGAMPFLGQWRKH